MRGRRISALVITGLLAIAAAGCGGGDELAPEVPGPPADVKVPQAAQPPADAAAAQNQASATATSTPDSSTGTDNSSGTGTATATPTPADTGSTQGGGTTAPSTTADSPSNDTPPPDGSNAQQFEDFCAQNPGAC